MDKKEFMNISTKNEKKKTKTFFLVNNLNQCINL